jgi:hypothetical protein
MESKDRPISTGKAVQYALLGAIAAMAFLFWALPPGPSGPSPLAMKQAMAEGVAAAPGFLLITIPDVGARANVGGVGGGAVGGGGGNRLYLADTTKEVLCTYSIGGDKIRLVGARNFSADTGIVDASLSNVPTLDANGNPVAPGTMKEFEGGNGLTRSEAVLYERGIKKLMERAAGNP